MWATQAERCGLLSPGRARHAGYSGDCLCNNLYYLDGQNICYFTAGVGIVFNRVRNTQQFFR